MDWFVAIIRYALVRWGYLALGLGLFAEDAGLPVPGEATLMFSSFLSHKARGLELGWVIVIGIASATLGDNLGFLAGRRLGPRLLRWMKRKFSMEEDIAVARDQIERHGKATVFWARYVFGLRTVTGPVAGALDMEWKEFLLYNAMGAATWVTSMALAGYLFAGAFRSFQDYFEKGSWAVSVGIFLAGYAVWRRRKKRYRERVAAR